MTSPNPKGLAAYLETNPEEVAGWVDGGQLRLLAAALTDLTAVVRTRSDYEAKDLKSQIAPLLSQPSKWETWWDKVRPWVKVSPHFESKQTGNTSTYRLALGVVAENIPVERLVGKPKADSTDAPSSSSTKKSVAKSSASQSLPQWVQWLWAKDDAPIPGTTPPDGLAALVGAWPEEIIQAAMDRLMTGVSEALTAPRLTPKAKDQWLELVSKAYQRRQGCLVPEYTEATARRTPKLLAQLLAALEQQAGIPSLLAEAGALTSANPQWRQDFAAGFWDAFKGNAATAETLLKRLASSFDDKQQVALWGDLLTAAFKGAYYPGRLSDLNRVMSWLKADLRATAIQRLILQAALHDRVAEGDVASFVAESRYAGKSDGPEKLNALVMAGLLLSEGSEEVIPLATQTYAGSVDQTDGRAHNALIASLLGVSIGKIEDAEKRWSDRLAQLQSSHTEEISGKEREILRLDEQAQTYSADLSAKRQESRFEIREGMLLHTGSVLQGMYQLEPEARIGYVMEHLPRILHAGEADVFEVVGDEVGYNPALHHSAEDIPSGSLVQVSAPGVILKGGVYPIIKANVIRKSGGS